MRKPVQETFYPETRFGGFSDVDGTVKFYTRVNALLEPSSVVLDAGCGRGSYGDDASTYRRDMRILKGKCKRVIGIDVNESARENPFLDEFRLIEGDRWPLEAQSIDLCICDYVMEHVMMSPEGFFSECARVIKAGGVLCIRTPNIWSYESIATRLVPNRFHAAIVGAVQEERKEVEVFPTVFRCNTLGKIRSMMRRHGFDVYVSTYSAEPSYLRFSRIVYAFGVIYHRIAPRILRSNIFAFGRKIGK